jgi:tetratricopeptide (TPR) repeat protein
VRLARVAFSALAACTAFAQEPATTPAPPSASVRHPALERDPAAVPHADADRWHDFAPEKLAPADWPREFLEAHATLKSGDLPATIGHLYAALDREPDFPPALHQMGVVYFQLQRYGDARTCFERYLAVVPDRVGDTRGLAHALYSLGLYAEARAHYERVLAVSPNDVEALRGHALSRYRLGDVEGALVDLTRVLELDPGHVDAWTWKSQVLLELDKPVDARAAAERARDLAPWAPRAWFALSAALNDMGREDEARAARERFEYLSRFDQEIRRLQAHLEHAPGDVGARRQLVDAQAEVGDRASVRTNLARLMADRPGDVAVRIYALDVCDRTGDVAAGKVAAQDLERVGADSVAAWKRLEQWYAVRRDRTKQIEAGERWRRASQH